MTKPHALALLDQLVGLETACALALSIAQALQRDPNPRLREFASTMNRHARGKQVSIAAIKQELSHSAR
jgi:hypothetical protein